MTLMQRVAPTDRVAALADVFRTSAEAIYWTTSKNFGIASKHINRGLKL